MSKASIAKSFGVSRPTLNKMLVHLKGKHTLENMRSRFGAGEFITLNELCFLYGVSKITMLRRLEMVKIHYSKYTAGIKRYSPKQVAIIREKLSEKGYEPLDQNQKP